MKYAMNRRITKKKKDKGKGNKQTVEKRKKIDVEKGEEALKKMRRWWKEERRKIVKNTETTQMRMMRAKNCVSKDGGEDKEGAKGQNKRRKERRRIKKIQRK